MKENSSTENVRYLEVLLYLYIIIYSILTILRPVGQFDKDYKDF